MAELDPVLEFIGGRPPVGTGRSSDYIGPPPDLSYLKAGRPDFIKADEPYDESLDVRNLIKEQGLPLDAALRVQEIRKQNYEDARKRKELYDQDWAMHYLEKADPTKSDFSEGLNKMFQQFPGAARSPDVARMVELKRGLSPKTDVPQELADTMLDYTALDPDDPEFAAKAAELSGKIKGTPAARHYKGLQFLEKVNSDMLTHKDRVAKRKDFDDTLKAEARRNKIPEKDILGEDGHVDHNKMDDALQAKMEEKESHDMELKLAMAGLNPDQFRTKGEDGKLGLVEKDKALVAIATKHANQLDPTSRAELAKAKIEVGRPITDDMKKEAFEAKHGRKLNEHSRAHWNEAYDLVKQSRLSNLEALTHALYDTQDFNPALSTEQKPKANNIKSIKQISP